MKISYNEPLNRVFLALNFYISTGDHIGEGVGTRQGNKTRIGLPVNTTDALDMSNWACLEARFEELKAEGFPFTWRETLKHGPFRIFEIELETAQLDAFALKLREKPGPCGWGSMKKFLEQHGIR